MQNAFRILGYPNPYHFSSMYGNVQDCDMWVDALRAKYEGIGTFGRAEFDQLLGHVGAVTDAPCILFAAELMEAYPDAKVVLVERNIDSWYKSFETLVTAAMDPFLNLFSYTDPGFMGRIQKVGFLWMKHQVGARNSKEAKANAKDMYRAYYAGIRRITPKDRLLEYKLGSGWEPLCEFLGKDVPDVPFPHSNESTALKSVFDEMGKKAVKNSAKNLAVVGSVVVAGVAALWMII
jgi:hypothetical protein